MVHVAPDPFTFRNNILASSWLYVQWAAMGFIRLSLSSDNSPILKILRKPGGFSECSQVTSGCHFPFKPSVRPKCILTQHSSNITTMGINSKLLSPFIRLFFRTTDDHNSCSSANRKYKWNPYASSEEWQRNLHVGYCVPSSDVRCCPCRTNMRTICPLVHKPSQQMSYRVYLNCDLKSGRAFNKLAWRQWKKPRKPGLFWSDLEIATFVCTKCKPKYLDNSQIIRT